MIEGVKIRPLRRIADPRGDILHMMRSDWDEFAGFGEIYFSCVAPGAIKAWRKHTRMTLQLAVPVGRVLMAMIDDRPESPTHRQIASLELGETEDAYRLVCVPPGVWCGYFGLGPGTAMMANCASIPHDPTEAEKADPSDPNLAFPWPAAPA